MMKKLLILAVVAYGCSSFAWVSTAPKENVYSFKFNYAGETLEIRKPASTYEDAFEQAASECFKHFKGSGKLSEDRGLDIIDVCANPRSI